MTWTKICGVRDLATAQQIAALAPSAIGLNFYASSPRFVDVRTAREIAEQLPANVEAVGLFVNHTVAKIAAIVDQVPLTGLQLHGDESATHVAEVRKRYPRLKLIRALRVGDDGLMPVIKHFWDVVTHAGASWDLTLLEAKVAGAYGGTGHLAPWNLLANWPQYELPPLILAGGLTPDNVADAMTTVAPWGVDVASGVESTPGVKDLRLVELFLRHARSV